MPARKTKPVRKSPVKPGDQTIDQVVETVLKELQRLSTKSTLDGMARYGIFADKAYGVSMANIQLVAKRFGPSHELALALWETEWYEARLAASMIDEPNLVTPAQMEKWCRDFDNWGVCDTVCFKLFDQSPHAWRKVAQWSDRQGEFQRRASFALLACLALHDKKAPEAQFLECLPLLERGATDNRNFVKKAIVWALRGIGGRTPMLHAAVLSLAQRLNNSPEAAAKWIGRETRKELTGPVAMRRLETQKKRSSAPTSKNAGKTHG